MTTFRMTATAYGIKLADNFFTCDFNSAVEMTVAEARRGLRRMWLSNREIDYNTTITITINSYVRG